MMHFLKIFLVILCFSLTAFAESNILGEEINILDGDLIDQEINKLNSTNSLNFNSITPFNKPQDIALNKVEINLWQRIYSGYTIKNKNNLRSKKYEDWYSARPEYLERMMDRTEKYLFYVVGEVEKKRYAIRNCTSSYDRKCI